MTTARISKTHHIYTQGNGQAGVAPLLVNLDCLTSTITDGSLEECLIEWDFDDPNGDHNTWSGGCVAVSHIYELPGSYNPSLTITDRAGNVSSTTIPVEVLAFPAVGLTRYVSATGSNANDGLTESTPWQTFDYAMAQATLLLTPKLPVPIRVLFKRDDTFNTPAGHSFGHYRWGDPAIIGNYGVGALPVIHNQSATAATTFSSLSWGFNFSFVDIKCTGTFDAAAAEGSYGNDGSAIGWTASGDAPAPPLLPINLMALRCEFANIGICLAISPFTQDVSWDYSDNVGVFDCYGRGHLDAVYGGAKHWAVVGNDFAQTWSHVVRFWWFESSILARNSLRDPAWSLTHTTPGCCKIHAPQDSVPKHYTRHFCLQDNLFQGGVWSVTLEPENNNSNKNEEVRDGVVERNHFMPSQFHTIARGTQMNMRTSGNNVHVRNNYFETGQKPGDININITIVRHPAVGVAAPADIHVYNNTAFCLDDAPLEACYFLWFEGLGIRRIFVRNNLVRFRGNSSSAFMRFYLNDANNLPIHALGAEEGNTFWRAGLTSSSGNWLVDDAGNDNTLDEWQNQGVPFGTRSKVEEALFTALANYDLTLTAGSPARVDGDLLPALFQDKAQLVRARPGSGKTVSRGAHEANPGGSNNTGKLVQGVSGLNFAGFARTDVGMCTLALEQGALTDGTDLYAENSTGQQEHVQWSRDLFPQVTYSSGNVAPAMRPPAWPDGSPRFIRAEIPFALSAAGGSPTDWAERVATIKLGTASTKPATFQLHADVLAGRADLRLFLSLQPFGGAREEIELRWSDAILVEDGLNSQLWRLWKRFGNGVAGDLTPVYFEVLVKLLRGQKHARAWVSWGFDHTTYGTGRTGDAWPAQSLRITGPVYMRVVGDAATFADFVIQADGDKCDRKATPPVSGSTREVHYFLLEPGRGAGYDVLPTGMPHYYEGVLLFGALDDTLRAEQLAEPAYISTDLADRLPPWFHTAPLPSFIANRADGVARFKALLGSRHFPKHPTNRGTLRDPYYKGLFTGNPTQGSTGEADNFGSDHLWPDIRIGYGARLPALKASTRQMCWPHAYREHDGRPGRFEVAGTNTIRFGCGIWAFDSQDYFGRALGHAPAVGELIPDASFIPQSVTSGQKWLADEQHWDRHADKLLALITSDPWALRISYHDMVRELQIDHPDAPNLTIAYFKEERGAGRLLKNHVLAWWLFSGSDTVMDTYLARRMNHPDVNRGYLAHMAAYNWAQSGRWAGLIVQLFASRSGTQQTTLPNGRVHVSVWMNAIHQQGMVAYYKTGLPGGDVMLRFVEDMAAWITREGWLHFDEPWQCFGLLSEQSPARSLPHEQRSGWNDETLAGRTVTGETSGATGRLVCAYRGGDPGDVVIADCVGTFLSGERITLSGPGSYSARIGIPRDPIVGIALYAAGPGSPNVERFLTQAEKEATVFDVVNTQEQGWRFANVLIGHFYTLQNAVAAVVGKWAAERGHYPIESRQAVLDDANRIIAALLATRVDNGSWGTGPAELRFVDEWLTVLPGAFGARVPDPEPPAAPSDHTLDGVSTTELLAQWKDNSGDEDEFLLQLSTVSAEGPWEAPIAIPANTTRRLITGRPVGTQHWSRVLARNARGGPSAWSPVATGSTMGVPKPQVPGNPLATGQPLRVRITFTADPEASGTLAEWHNGTTWEELARLPAGTAEVTDTNFVAAGTSRSYRLVHWRTIGTTTVYGEYTLPFVGTCLEPPVVGSAPAAPSDLTVPTVGSASASLFWTRNATNETLVEVWRKEGAGAFRIVGQLLPGTVNFEDTTVIPGATTTWKVRNVNDVGPSAFSNTVTETIPVVQEPDEIDPPVLAADAVGPSLVEVTITPPAQAFHGYFLERHDLTTGVIAFFQLDDSVTLFADRTVVPEHDYEYQARAFNDDGRVSDPSNVASVSTPAPGSPPGVSVLTVTPHATLPQLGCSWTAASGADGYKLWIWDPEDETWTLAADQVGLTFTVTGLRKGTQYLLYVEAYNENGSTVSVIVLATTARPLPRAILLKLTTAFTLELEGR